MVFACGLSNYSVSIYHLVNHGFFVWQHRYLNLIDSFSYRNWIQGKILTYFLSKLEDFWNKKGELMWTLIKTSLSWLNFSTLLCYRQWHSYEKISQEKDIKKLHIKSWWSIESTWLLLRFGDNIFNLPIKILKVGKPVNLITRIKSYLSFINPINWVLLMRLRLQYGCRIVTKRIALSNIRDRFFWIASWEGWIDYSCLNILKLIFLIQKKTEISFLGYGASGAEYLEPKFFFSEARSEALSKYLRHYTLKKSVNSSFNIGTSNQRSWMVPLNYFTSHSYNLALFKAELKFLFQPYRDLNILYKDLYNIILRYIYILNISIKNMRLLDNIIHQGCWLWVKKKHPKTNKNKLYHQYFAETPSLNKLKLRYIIKKNSIELIDTKSLHTFKENNKFIIVWNKQKIIFKWINIENHIEIILDLLKNKSGIYIFWLTKDKKNCYIGSGVNLSRRIKTHYKNALITNKHPKFYNAIKKYGWSQFSLQILDLVPKSHLIIREQYWLTLLQQSGYWNDSYNLLEKANSWLGYQHTLESKLKMSKSKKGILLTPEHRQNISLGKLGPKHHLYGKKRSLDTIEKIRMKSLRDYPSLKTPFPDEPEERKKVLSKLNSKPLVLKDKNGNEIKNFTSVTSAMKELKIGHIKLKKLLNGEIFHHENQEFTLHYL